MYIMIRIDKEKCIGCGLCIDDCFSKSLSLFERKAVYTGDCIKCGHCVAICPVMAVSIPEFDMADIKDVENARDRIDADSLSQMIKERRTIRHFKHKTVEKEKIERMIDAGRYTATAKNTQGNRFVVVEKQLESFKQMVWRDTVAAVREERNADAGLLAQYARYYVEEGIDYLFRDASVLICIANALKWDANMAAQTMEFMAVAQGLGVMYDGLLMRAANLSEEAIKLLDLQGKPLAACMLVGYSNVTYKRTAPRKKADVHWL